MLMIKLFYKYILTFLLNIFSLRNKAAQFVPWNVWMGSCYCTPLDKFLQNRKHKRNLCDGICRCVVNSLVITQAGLNLTNSASVQHLFVSKRIA